MSRPLRLEYSGALWHVTSRGNERKAIFADDADRSRFVEILGDTVQWANWRLHAYVLMGNHYHLMIETPETTLSRGMRQLNGVYTQYFNSKHKRSGHLFQGRFKGILVEKEGHLSELIRYIVLNPVRAKLCARAKDWRWSSYRATAGMANAPPWLYTQWTWQFFNRHNRTLGKAGFRRFVNGRKGEAYRPWPALKNQIFLGSDAFLDGLSSLYDEASSSHEVSRRQRDFARPGMTAVIKAVALRAGVSAAALGVKRGGPARGIAAHAARALARLKLREIAMPLNIQSWSVPKLAQQGEKLAAEDAKWGKIWKQVTQDLQTKSLS